MSNSLDNNFEIDVNNYLSNDYNDYIAKMTALSLTKPVDYLNLRTVIRQKIHRIAISSLYKTIFSALTKGEDPAGFSLFSGVNGIVADEFKVKYPNQLATEIAASAAKSLQSILDEVVSKIIPDLLNGVLSERLSKLNKTDIV